MFTGTTNIQHKNLQSTAEGYRPPRPI